MPGGTPSSVKVALGFMTGFLFIDLIANCVIIANARTEIIVVAFSG